MATMNPDRTPLPLAEGAEDGGALKGYPWPASRLTRADMEKLTQLRATTGRPITVLIHEAISVLSELLQGKTPTRLDHADDAR
jgi:hypothetical protein